jgi:hypothetical protein
MMGIRFNRILSSQLTVKHQKINENKVNIDLLIKFY